MEQEKREEFERFLSGTFHQDIDDPEEALLDYIYSVDKSWLKEISSIINLFLDTNEDEQERYAIIEDNVEINFPALGVSPTEWLKSVLNTIDRYTN